MSRIPEVGDHAHGRDRRDPGQKTVFPVVEKPDPIPVHEGPGALLIDLAGAKMV